MNQREMILRVAVTLPEVFTPADLVVACWRHDPDTFGLAGHRAKYPDAVKITSKLYGSTGLVARGLVEQLGHDRFRVTARGRAAVAARGAA